MVATHGGPAGDVFLHIARLFDRTAYRGRIQVDPEQVRALQDLHRRYPVALFPSHRSYIDPVVLASVLQRAGLPPTYKLGGINVSFWPMGPMGRRAGLIFIRRSFRDDPIYKLALREYVGWLAEHRQNLEWYIEGGRTRTGKLRDPRLGLLAYLVDAVHDGRCDDFVLQPVSIVYDELLDVEEHARSVQGATKAPESFTRLVSYARAQRSRYSRGDIHVAFGEPISVRDHLTRELTEAADGRLTLPTRSRCRSSRSRWRCASTPSRPSRRPRSSPWRCCGPTARSPSTSCSRCSSATPMYVDERGFPVTCRPIATRDTAAARARVTAAPRRGHPQRPRARRRVPDPTRAAHRRRVPPQRHPPLLRRPRDRRPRQLRRRRGHRCTTTRSRCATCSSSSSSSRRRASSSPRSTPRWRRSTGR